MVYTSFASEATLIVRVTAYVVVSQMATKNCAWTLDKKFRLIKEYEKSGKSKSAFAKINDIPRTTLITILSSKERIEKALLVQDGSKRKKLRLSKFEEVEDALVKWFTIARANNVPISGLVLKEKSIEIAREFNIKEFTASNGWMERFKERHGLTFKKVCGEEAAVNVETVEEWKNSSLKDVLEKYEPGNVYNLDETGLFFRVLPERTLCFRSLKCVGGKKSKERLTVLLGANMTGTDRLRPLVIGKSAKPRCFKNVRSLPVDYKANSKSWMSSAIWQETLMCLDKKFTREKRKVAFIVDNCTAHVEVKNLKSIEVIYMPPNVTSVLQPLDQGVIFNFKRNYRKLLIQDMIKAIDASQDFRVSVLDAIKYVHKSWNDVSTLTIQNCFRHAGFIKVPESNEGSEITEDSEEDEDVPLAVLFQELLSRKTCTENDCAAYINIDEDVSTSSEATIPEIVEEVREARNGPQIEILSDDSDGSDNEMMKIEKPPTKKETLHAIDVVRRYILSTEESTDLDHDCLYKIEKTVLRCKSRDGQTRIEQFFKSK